MCHLQISLIKSKCIEYKILFNCVVFETKISTDYFSCKTTEKKTFLESFLCDEFLNKTAAQINRLITVWKCYVSYHVVSEV